MCVCMCFILPEAEDRSAQVIFRPSSCHLSLVSIDMVDSFIKLVLKKLFELIVYNMDATFYGSVKSSILYLCESTW